MSNKVKVKVFLLALLVTALAFSPLTIEATDYQCSDPPCEGGAGTCAYQCADGSWSSIGCLSGQRAYCTCGGSPVQANPYCW